MHLTSIKDFSRTDEEPRKTWQNPCKTLSRYTTYPTPQYMHDIFRLGE